MGRKKQTNEEKLQETMNELEKSFNQWNNINTNGCSDPFWSDGVNMNLVHNHIFNYKKQIKELCEITNIPLPDIYFKDTPPEVDQNYYAQADTIIATAKKIIEQVESTYNLDGYKENSLLVRYLNGYKKALNENNLAYVRGYSFMDFLEYEKKSEKKLHNFNESKEGQLQLKATQTTVKNKEDIPSAVIKQKEKLLSLYNNCLNEVKCNWTSFLDTSINTHKHNFQNQAMIFGQDKNALTVADEKTWSKVGRYLSFNAEYITTISKKKDCLIETRLYDINQTYGDEVVTVDNLFHISDIEKQAIQDNLSNKFKVNTNTLTDTIKYIVAGIYKLEYLPLNIKPYERSIKNSVYYVVCKRLGLISSSSSFENKFRDIQNADNTVIAQIGKSVQTSSKKILNQVEKIIENIRSAEHDRTTNRDIQQQTIYSISTGIVQEPGERNNLQTGEKRNQRNSDISTSNRDSAGGGQLSFGQIWQTADEIHGERTQRQVLGVSDERNPDGETSRERGLSQGTGIFIDGTDREEKSTSENREHTGSSSAHGTNTISSNRNGERGTLQTDLVDNRINYKANSTVIEYGGAKVKYRANIEAIKLLKQIENEERLATADEQYTLARYTGFGGIAKAFDEKSDEWKNEYQELKELLSPAEYEKARESTLTAYYTEPKIIEAMYKGIMNLGVDENSKILEPSMGIGNFFSMLPNELNKCELYGVELDDLSGRIAKQLYQKADIQIKGYQDTGYRDNFFDFSIGNVPFGDFKVFDERYVKS